MTLTGTQIAQLLDALLDAYPRRDDLRMMVRVELNENLDAIAGGDTLRAVAFSLIEWAIYRGRVEELIAGAQRSNPGNMTLRNAAGAFHVTLDPRPGESVSIDSTPPVLTITIRPRMEQVYTALADLFDPAERPLIEVELVSHAASRVHGERTVAQRLLVSSHIQEYSHVAERTVSLTAGATTTVCQLPALRKPAVQGITELTKAELTVSVHDLDADRTVRQESFRIDLLARNAAPIATRDPHTNVWIDMTHYLAAFVTPNAPAVLAVLRQAINHHPAQRLAGYQADVPLQVNALYDVLKYDIGLAYIQSTLSFNPDAAAFDQRVRLPRESLAARSANCLDAALLVVSLLEACSLNPALLVSKNHALVGWETRPGSGEWAYLETTVFLDNDFAEARELGERKAAFFRQQAQTTGDAAWFRLLPIAALRRQHRITPLE